MYFKLLNSDDLPEGFDEEALKGMAIDHMASLKAKVLNIKNRAVAYLKQMEEYAIGYEKRKGGEDMNPVENCDIELLGHISANMSVYQNLLKDALRRQDSEAVAAFSRHLSRLEGAFEMLKELP